jgi:late competence protein required for DNA uptake (superfamily II DNA/RNA helicase)
MTSEQAPVYHQVLTALRDNTPLCKMIDARAGRGKTWLVNLIVAAARAEGIVTVCVATPRRFTHISSAVPRWARHDERRSLWCRRPIAISRVALVCVHNV